MKQYLIAALAVASTSVWAAEKLSVEVGYGGPVGGTSTSGIYTAAPDTSFVVIKNTGDNRFTGSFSLTGLSGIGVFGHIDVDDHSVAAPGGGGPIADVTLGPGESWTLYGGPEASNYGGYNKCQDPLGPLGGMDPAGPHDSGMLLNITGTFLGSGLDIDYSIYDYEIHSGVARATPDASFVLDNYILQGGDPVGRDWGDAYEESQAHAFFDVAGSRVASPLDCPVPDAGGTMLLLSSGLFGLMVLRRKLGA